MGRKQTAIAYLDARRMHQAFTAGIHHVFLSRDYLNKINVFPVPDGDTGTNMAFTFKTVLEACARFKGDRIDHLMAVIAEAALDGARGNSGAIMAQYFHGFAEAVNGHRLLTAERLVNASLAGSEAAWGAMAEPVAGTLPTVLEDFSSGLQKVHSEGIQDIRNLLHHGLEAARQSLANTPKQLAVLRQAGVVDAGGQGFVDFLEGIRVFVETGEVRKVAGDLADPGAAVPEVAEVGDHRYCTECVISGDGLKQAVIMDALKRLDASSLVVAGGPSRVRVHIHVNNPASVYLACEEFGAVTQQKADDMRRQHSLMNQAGSVAVVADSGADIPPAEVERLGLHLVPVRLSFGDREYLDGISLTAEEFYDMLQDSEEAPLTSQPPVQDFSRVYSLLTSHGYDVISVGLSLHLSGTTSAALQAAGRQESGRVRVIDSLSAATGQGLLAMVAAEAAAMAYSADEVEALLRELIPQTRVFAVADNLASAVKGGRVPAWIKRLTDLFHINPVLTASPKGKLVLAGFHLHKGATPAALARSALRKMRAGQMYRVMISHANNREGANELRRYLLHHHGQIHSCHVTDAGPAIGVHLGPGGLIVGTMPEPDQLTV